MAIARLIILIGLAICFILQPITTISGNGCYIYSKI